MHSFLKTLLVGTVLAIGCTAVAAAADATDAVIGVWKLNLAMSTLNTCPAPKSPKRAYKATA